MHVYTECVHLHYACVCVCTQRAFLCCAALPTELPNEEMMILHGYQFSEVFCWMPGARGGWGQGLRQHMGLPASELQTLVTPQSYLLLPWSYHRAHLHGAFPGLKGHHQTHRSQPLPKAGGISENIKGRWKHLKTCFLKLTKALKLTSQCPKRVCDGAYRWLTDPVDKFNEHVCLFMQIFLQRVQRTGSNWQLCDTNEANRTPPQAATTMWNLTRHS